MTVTDPARPPIAQQPTLSLRLVDWAGAVVALGVEPVVRDGVVDYRHGALVERYRIDEHGFEQQFVIAEPPQVAGDLVFGIAATGNVACAARDAAHQSLQFTQPDGQAIGYGAAKTIDAAGRETAIATRYDGDGRIELIVPADVVRSAAYPLLVDPAVGFVTTLVPAQGTQVKSPDIAFDPDNDRYLLVWWQGGGLSSTLWGRFFDEQGVPFAGAFVIGSGQYPSVSFTRALGTPGFCVAFVNNDRAYATVVSSGSGAPLMAAPVMVSSPSASNVEDSFPSVSCGSGSVMVGYNQVQTVAGGSKAVRVRLLLPSNGALVRSVEGALELAGPGETVREIQLPDYHVTEQLLGTSWRTRAVWTHTVFTSNPNNPFDPFTDVDVRTASFRITAGGIFGSSFTVIDPPSTPSGGGATTSTDQEFASIATTADEEVNPAQQGFVLAWQSNGTSNDFVQMAHYDMGGQVGSHQTVSSGGAPAVAAGSCEYTIAYWKDGAAREIAAARVRRDGSLATADVFVSTTGINLRAPVASSRALLQSPGNNAGNTTMIAWNSSSESIQGRRFEPVTSTFAFLGTACTSGGYTPTALTNLTPAIAGNAGFAINLSSAPPGSLAALVIGTQATSLLLPGTPCTLEVALPFVAAVPVLTDLNGSASVPLPMPCSIPNGAQLAMQFGIYAPGANAFGWTLSNGIQLTWSH